MANSQSTYTLQNLSDSLLVRGDLKPILTAGGFNTNMLCDIATDVFAAMCDTTVPWKWNETNLPTFFTNSYQQDYALVFDNGTSLTNLAWLTDGISVLVNNSSTPKPWSWIEVGRRQGKSTATVLSNSFYAFPQFTCSWLPNNLLYYAVFGATDTANSTFGNNPQPNQLISNPIGSGNSQPKNPCLQIQDANGNFLVCTGFGTTGAAAPVAPVDSLAGVTATSGGTTWTVVDPQGQGIRMKPIPSQTGPVWGIYLTGQMKPIIFSPLVSLNQQTLFPMTNDYYNTFKQGCIAQTYLYSPETAQRAKGEAFWQRWVQTVNSLSLQAGKQQGERERDLDRVIPAASVLGAGAPRVGWVGSAWPYGYPIS